MLNNKIIIYRKNNKIILINFNMYYLLKEKEINMNLINFISISAIPLIILLIIAYGYIEKNNVYDVFLEGAKEGIKIVYNIIPTLIGIFVAVGMLRCSGIIELIIKYIYPFLKLFNIPGEILPLAIIRPISGSAAVGIATDLMNIYGVDSKIGKMASVIMGATETTFYTIAIYTSCVKIKKTRGIIFAALVGDVVGIAVSIFICNIM